MSFLENLCLRQDLSPAGQQLRQLVCDFAVGGVSGLERVRINLDVDQATEEKLGPGFWVFVESGGNSAVTFTTKPHFDAKDDKFKHPLDTGQGVNVPFHDGIVKIPKGITGDMVLQVARYPIPFPFHRRIQIVDSTNALITAVNPFPVDIVRAARLAGAPGVKTGIGTSSVEIVPANALRKGVYLRNKSLLAQVIDLGFNGNPAEAGKGVNFLPEEEKSWDVEDGLGPGTGAIVGISSAAAGIMQFQQF